MARRTYDNPDQMNLLEMIKEQEAALIRRPDDEPGSLNQAAAIREALADSIARCGKPRYQIAAEMSVLLDVEITKTMLDAYTATSKDGYRFPLEYAAAFCKVTGSNKVLEVVCRPVGVYALDGPDALRSQLQKRQEERRQLYAEEKEIAKLINLFERGGQP